MKTRLYVMFLFVAFLLGGCTTRIFDFTIVSTKNVDLSKMGTYERGRQRVEGEDYVYWILDIPLGIPNLKEAIDRAIEVTPGAVALVDGVAYSKFWWALLVARSSYVVEGTPIIDPALVSLDKSYMGKYNVCRLDKEGNVKEIKAITEDEYEEMKSKIVASKYR